MTSSAEYYDAIARGYAGLHRQEQMTKFRSIMDHFEIKPTDTVLDVGCGPCFAFDIWPAPTHCKEMVGVDPSAGLIEQARERGVTRTLVSRAEDMMDHLDVIQPPEGGFDVVISLTAVQNFDDLEKGISNMVALGKDRFAITYLKRTAKAKAIDEIIERLLDVTLKHEQEYDIIYFCTKKKEN